MMHYVYDLLQLTHTQNKHIYLYIADNYMTLYKLNATEMPQSLITKPTIIISVSKTKTTVRVIMYVVYTLFHYNINNHYVHECITHDLTSIHRCKELH